MNQSKSLCGAAGWIQEPSDFCTLISCPAESLAALCCNRWNLSCTENHSWDIILQPLKSLSQAKAFLNDWHVFWLASAPTVGMAYYTYNNLSLCVARTETQASVDEKTTSRQKKSKQSQEFCLALSDKKEISATVFAVHVWTELHGTPAGVNGWTFVSQVPLR